ncbi:hypothetical protein [Hydrogenophaga sp.]|uniref:hypothetical protein n=1 Tax=Hydrogenophaga sp. TaxID=1904254 RepID=UPI00272DA3CE|nr:hypothetical protein [Hydrogenophaga sp.]
MTPLFQGEVQLRRWSESSTQGVQVTFALADSDDLEPLKMKSGKRFMAVLVEIGDDEKPVQPPPTQLGTLGLWLVQRGKDPDFWHWLASDLSYTVGNEDQAADAVKHILGVKSRKDVDGDAEAEKAFHAYIRIPYQRWLAKGKK